MTDRRALFASTKSGSKDFEGQCSDMIVYFKELLSFSDPNITTSRLLHFEREFLGHAQRIQDKLSLGFGTVSPENEAEALSELQHACFNELYETYKEEDNMRILGILDAVRSLNSLNTRIKPLAIDEEEESSPKETIEAHEEEITVKPSRKCTKSVVLEEVKSRISILEWAPKYNLDKFKNDCIAALAVGLMIIPQGLAYALLAGVKPIYGLYTAVLPLFVYFVFGSSRELAIGPTAMVSLILPTAIGDLAQQGTDEYAHLASFYCLIYGIILFLIGFFKVGFLLDNVLSRPALSGFTQGASILIACSQIKNVLGYHAHSIYTVDNLIAGLIEHRHEIKWLTSVIGISSLVIILIMKKVKKTFPTIILILITGIALAKIIDAEKHGIEIVHEVPPGLPAPKGIMFSRELLTKTIGAIIVLAFIGFVEAVSVAKRFAAEHQYNLNVNQELFALGLCSLLGAWFQAYPVGGSLPRTVVNAHTGSKSPLSSLMAGIIVALMLLFGTKLIYYTPYCILAAIVMSAALSIIDYSECKFLWKMNQKADVAIFLLTDIATAFFGPIIGVATAGFLSLIQVIYYSSRPEVYEVGKLPDSVIYKDMGRFPVEPVSGMLIIGINAPRLSFYNFGFFRETLEQFELRFAPKVAKKHKKEEKQSMIENGETNGTGDSVELDDGISSSTSPTANIQIQVQERLHTIVFDFTNLDSMDATAAQYLMELVDSYQKKNISILFAGLKPGVRSFMKQSKITALPPHDPNVFHSVHEAVNFALKKVAESREKGTFIEAPEITTASEQSESALTNFSKIFTVDYNSNDTSLL